MNAPEFKNIDHASAMMKLQNAVARESISHHQVTANTNDKKKKSKVNQRSHQDRAGVSNPRNTLGNWYLNDKPINFFIVFFNTQSIFDR